MAEKDNLLFYKSLLDTYLAIDSNVIAPKIYISMDGVVFHELFRERSKGADNFAVENQFGYAWKGTIVRNGDEVTLYVENDKNRPVFNLVNFNELSGVELVKLPYTKFVKKLYYLGDRFVCWVEYKFYPLLPPDIWFGKRDSMKKSEPVVERSGGFATSFGFFDPGDDWLAGFKLRELNEKMFNVVIDGESMTISEKE